MVVGEELADDLQAVCYGPVRGPAGARADIRVRGVLEQGIGIRLFPRSEQNPLRLDPVFFPSHLDVRDAVQDEGLGGLLEPHLLVEALRVFLGLDVDDPGIEMLPGRGDALQHDPLAVPLAALCRYDTPDGNLLHMRPGRADPAQGDDLVAFREP